MHHPEQQRFFRKRPTHLGYGSAKRREGTCVHLAAIWSLRARECTRLLHHTCAPDTARFLAIEWSQYPDPSAASPLPAWIGERDDARAERRDLPTSRATATTDLDISAVQRKCETPQISSKNTRTALYGSRVRVRVRSHAQTWGIYLTHLRLLLSPFSARFFSQFPKTKSLIHAPQSEELFKKEIKRFCSSGYRGKHVLRERNILASRRRWRYTGQWKKIHELPCNEVAVSAQHWYAQALRVVKNRSIFKHGKHAHHLNLHSSL